MKPRPTPRERVLQQTRRLLTLGAAAGGAVLTNCGYTVVDPVPPPASCREESNLDHITAFRSQTGRVAVVIPPVVGRGVREDITDPTDVTGGTFVLSGPDGTGSTELLFMPDANATELTFKVSVRCIGTNGTAETLTIKVLLDDGTDGGVSLTVIRS